MAVPTRLARRVADKRARGALEAGRRRTRNAVSAGIGRLLRLLPVTTVVGIKTSLHPVVRLDYQRDTVLLHADSEMDLIRARACTKEPDTVSWIEAHVRAGDVFYDIGANVGAYAFVAARQAPGRVLAHAFEPSFSTYRHLCDNVILNGCQDYVFPHLIALGQSDGVTALNYHSVEAGASLHAVGENIDFRGTEFEPVYRQPIFMFSLDRLVSDWGFKVPNHIKIDVDGTEFDVLLGARAILRDVQLKTVLVEVCHDRGHSDDIGALMAESGFQLQSEVFLQPTASNRVYTRSSS